MAFGDILKELRQQKGMTQAGLAEAAGMPLGTIRDYEQGKRDPLLSNAQKLAAALGISMDRFSDSSPEAPQSTDGRLPKNSRGRPRKEK